MGIMLSNDTRTYIVLKDCKPEVGTKVRSYDFPCGENEADDGCFVEGTIVAITDKIGEHNVGCDRYKIKVERKVFSSEESKIRDEFVYPPVNGTPTSLGRKTMYVQLMD